MKNFWTFYQNIEQIEHPFHVFGTAHFLYILVTIAVVILCFHRYKKCSESGRTRWQHCFAWYLFIQEMFFYAWTYVNCKENVVFEVLQLELCTACLFMNFSTIFHQNKQVRFFSALLGFIGGPIAMIYPATVADIYPAFSYRLLNFFMTHGTYILFSLMLLQDGELMNRKRLWKHLGIVGCMLTAVYFFDLKFHTQYMFVGTPPSIGIIRMVYDFVGNIAFLPTAILIFSAVEVLMFFGVRKIQKFAYRQAV